MPKLIGSCSVLTRLSNKGDLGGIQDYLHIGMLGNTYSSPSMYKRMTSRDYSDSVDVEDDLGNCVLPSSLNCTYAWYLESYSEMLLNNVVHCIVYYASMLTFTLR